MDKSGPKQSRFLLTPPRRPHRRTPVFLNEKQRYLVAEALMNGKKPRDISEYWGISEAQISKIKFEFLEVVTVWKPGVLDKFKGTFEKPVETLQMESAMGVQVPKK